MGDRGEQPREQGVLHPFDRRLVTTSSFVAHVFGSESYWSDVEEMRGPQKVLRRRFLPRSQRNLRCKAIRVPGEPLGTFGTRKASSSCVRAASGLLQIPRIRALP